MRTRKSRLILVGTATVLLILATVIIITLFVLPSGIQPIGTGIPEITSQFSAIKTRAKTSTPDERAELRLDSVQLVRFVGDDAPRPKSMLQTVYESCTVARRVTATPTGQALPAAVPVTLTAEAEGTSAAPDFVVLRVVSAESEACYQVGEIFISDGNRFAVAVGVTRAINGEIAIDRANVANSQIGEFVIDISQLRSDAANRDGAIRQEWLESNRFPLAKLLRSRVVGLPSRAYREGEVLTFQIVGELEIRNVQKTITFQATASLSGNQLVATAYADIRMTDFGIAPPTLFGLTVNDEMRIVLNIVAREPEVVDPPTLTSTATALVAAVAPTVPAAVECRPTASRSANPPEITEPPIRSFVDSGHVLSGVIRSGEDCAPIANAKIIFWLVNPNGEYAAAHTATILTDASGAYRFESNFPGSYDGVQPHIHIYVAADGYRPITTEYLPKQGQTEGELNMVMIPEP